MESAFGVDHGDYGEIEKFGFGGLGSALGGAARLGAKNVGQLANKVPAGKFGSGAAKGGLIKVGQGLKKTSQFAAAKPGLTGGIAAGGAAAGLGGGAAMMGNRRKQY
jgi:hypothetical protein